MLGLFPKFDLGLSTFLSERGWGFPIMSKVTKSPLSMQLFGEEKDLSHNLKDHEIVSGAPVFVGYSTIDLKASKPFRIKFAYPTVMTVMAVHPGQFGEREIFPVRKMFFRKNQTYYWSPEKASTWGAFPVLSELWFVQTRPSGSRA